jgi:hypothetical protein
MISFRTAAIAMGGLLLGLAALGAHQAALAVDGKGKHSKQFSGHDFPDTAYEFAKQVEPMLGVPPRVDLSEGVEVPIYIDGKQVRGTYRTCDNPSRLGKGCISGSVVQRYEGRTADGERMPEVVWVAFARNSNTAPGKDGKVWVLGSVQMIGYREDTGATAFFESSDRIHPWTTFNSASGRLEGVMPWVDDPEEFNKAFKVPGMIQCVECHQNDPFIHNGFIDAALLPDKDKPVVPVVRTRDRDMEFDLPYYAIGGDNWDMRTIHIDGNGCLDCHRVGMATASMFMRYGWDANEHMPPKKPGSLAEDWKALQMCWENTPENTPGCDWVIPPTGDALGRVVGDDYPYKQAFNQPGYQSFFEPGKGFVDFGSKKDFGAKGNFGKKGDFGKQAEMDKKATREELIRGMKAKGMSDEEIEKWLPLLQ